MITQDMLMEDMNTILTRIATGASEFMRDPDKPAYIAPGRDARDMSLVCLGILAALLDAKVPYLESPLHVFSLAQVVRDYPATRENLLSVVATLVAGEEVPHAGQT